MIQDDDQEENIKTAPLDIDKRQVIGVEIVRMYFVYDVCFVVCNVPLER